MRSAFFIYIHGKLNFNSVMLNLGFFKFKYLVVLFLMITALTGIAQENPSATIRAFPHGGEITSGATTDKDEITFNIYLSIGSSEAVTSDFTVGDLTVSGGVLSDFAYNSTYNYYEVKLTTSTQGNYTLDINANTFTSGGTGNLAASQFSWTYDAIPTMTITAANGSTAVADGATTNDGTLTLTFTSSETTNNFIAGDVSVSGGSLSSFSGSGAVYTATFTPSSDGATTIDVAASKFTDAAGNNNTAATQFNWTRDQVVPTIDLLAHDENNNHHLMDGATTSDAKLYIQFTVSESVTNFAIGDISVTGGTLSTFAGSGRNYTVVFTPSADGATTIDIAANTFTDAAGNNNTAATRFNWTFDTTKPTMIITAANGSTAVADGATTNDGTLTLTFTSSEAITNFTSGSLTLSGGSLSSFSATSSSVFTGVFTPSADGATTIDIAADIFADAAGNTNTAVPQFNWTYDSTRPTMAITASNGSTAVADGATTNDLTLNLTFTSSEVTTNFASGDVSVSGGTLSRFVATSSTLYTGVFTPSADGATTIDIAASTFTDAAGNGNTAATQFNWNAFPRTVTLSLDQSTIAENGTATITANLDISSTTQTIVSLAPTGTAFLKADYGVSGTGDTSSSTVAGGNGNGSADNQLGSSSNPALGVVLDASRNIYIADEKNHRIQKWAPGATTGITVAGGNGSGAAENQLSDPTNLALDASGNIYVLDRGNSRVQKWVPGASTGTTVAGGNGSGPAANQIDVPPGGTSIGIGIDNLGNIYLSDRNNNRVQKWAPGAIEAVTVAGGNGSGDAANQLYRPEGIALDVSGNLYVADSHNQRIQRWSPGATEGVTVAGGNGYGSGANQLWYPVQVSVDAGYNVYIVGGSSSGNQIQRWALNATQKTTLGAGSGAVADASGNIYVSDVSNFLVKKVSNGIPQIVIAAGETTATLTVTGIDDTIDESDETIILTPSVTGATLASSAALNITMSDNDLPPAVSSVTATSVDGNYKLGDTIAITVVFDKAVSVSGTPQLTLETGLTDAVVNYSSGSRTDTLTFNYAVSSNHFSADLDYVSSNSLVLNDAVIVETIGTSAATLTLPVPGSSNSLGANKSIVADGTVSTMTITATNGSTTVANDAITKDSTLTLTFTSSEVTTDFTTEDVTVSGGTLSDFAATSTTVYNAKFTPSSSGATTIDVAASTFTDAVGNNNTAAVQFKWTYDGMPPTITITASNGSNVVADSSRSQDTSLTVTFTSSEATTDFNADSINVIGGKLTDFVAVSATVYTAKLTPAVDIATVYYGGTFIEILANKFSDALGNYNADTSLFNWTYDIAGPSMRISAYRASNGVGVSNQGAANEGTLKIQFSSSESTTDFTIEDIVVSGGVMSEFSGVGTNYTATFVSSQEGAMSVGVAADLFLDEAGNINTAAEPFGWTYDATPPEMIIMAMTHGAQAGEFVNGSMTNDDSLFITFSFSEALMSFDRGDLNLINGDLSEIKSLEMGGDENLFYDANLKPRGDGLVTVGIKKGSLKDKAGNEVILFDSLSWTYDGTAPTMRLVVTNNGDVIIDGAVVNDGSKTVTFTSSEPTTDFTVDSIALTGGSLSDFIAVNDTMYTATFMPSVTGVNSIVVAENSFTDAVGNYNTGIAYYVSIGAATFGIHESLVTAGGDSVTTGGEVSYTLGQLSKATLYDINESEDTLYVVQQGIQQPYEIAEILGMEETTISLSVVAYPNPTYEVLTLKIENYKNEELTYQLHDLQGKLLDRNRVRGSSTTINMAGLSPNMYLLSISSDQSLIKTFRIIKN